ncbi:MerR family transcriptional regulator [bacterium]|nr:MerR family transcriptional regulator [bacterium]
MCTQNEKTYTIGKLAHLAGVSVRTLRHYDQIGLLQPGGRDPSNDYRQYGYDDLLRLQQILFFRELDVPLKQIKRILDDPLLDRAKMLRQHHHSLALQVKRLQTLQHTIEKTTQNLEEEGAMPLTDKELYEGFDRETVERYQKEVREQYDPDIVDLADRNVRKMSKTQWASVKEEGGEIARALAELMDRAPSDPEVQTLAARQHAWLEHFYPVSAERFRGLASLYTTNPEFRAFYDTFAPGLADFLKQAMDYYADTVLDKKAQ